MSTICGWAHLGKNVQIYDPIIVLKPEMVSIGDGSRLDSFQKWEGGLGITVGKGCHFSSFVHLNVGGGRLEIGNLVAITTGAAIITGSNTMDGQAMSSAAQPEMQVIERGAYSIGKFAFVGAHAVVYRANIGHYAVVGAGAVVTKDVEPYAIVFGCPARKVGDRRDREGWHFA